VSDPAFFSGHRNRGRVLRLLLSKQHYREFVMRVAAGALSTSEIIDKIYEAYTLEDAVFWREEFVARLSRVILRSDVLDPNVRDEVNLYAQAKAQSEQAIARLQFCLANNERWTWSEHSQSFRSAS
jgi:hypothetical protein